MPLKEALATLADGPHKRRINMQELIRHVLILYGANMTQGRALRGKMARQLLDALQKGASKSSALSR